MDWHSKGLPHGAVDINLSEIAAKRWNVLNEDLPLPVAVLRDSALTKNRHWMREFLARTGAKLAPHGKTHMSPQILRWQLEDGAWAITLATVHQVRIARAAGINRILLANEMVGVRDIEYVLDELRRDPSFEFFCLVDSVVGVNRLTAAARRAAVGRPVQLLIEVGYPQGRAGCREPTTVRAVAQAIKAAAPQLELVGVEGFEGLHSRLPASEAVPKVLNFLKTIVHTAEWLDKEGFFVRDEIILSAGGSAYYDLVTESFSQARLIRKACTVLRSGCYFAHDAGEYERLFSEALERSIAARNIGERFDSALEVWAYVLSVPERGRAILGAGRRDFGHDAGSPVAVKHSRPGAGGAATALTRDFQIVGINDQHAHMSFPAGADLQVGDLVGLGISHPCTTFDKWRLLYVVDDRYNIESAVQTYF